MRIHDKFHSGEPGGSVGPVAHAHQSITVFLQQAFGAVGSWDELLGDGGGWWALRVHVHFLHCWAAIAAQTVLTNPGGAITVAWQDLKWLERNPTSAVHDLTKCFVLFRC